MRAVGVASYLRLEVGERREVRGCHGTSWSGLQDGWHIPADREGAELCLAIGERNADEGVTWLHSYVSDDRTKSFCVYEAPTPEAIRRTAARNDLPVDVITQVRVLDPYFYD